MGEVWENEGIRDESGTMVMGAGVLYQERTWNVYYECKRCIFVMTPRLYVSGAGFVCPLLNTCILHVYTIYFLLRCFTRYD